MSFFINGYKSFDVFRNNYGGGIRLYVKESINVSILQQFTITNDVIELLTAEICTLDNKFLLCCVYHPPSSDHGFNYEFIEQFRQTLTLLRSMSIPIVVGGDVNLNLFNPLQLNYINYFVDTMLELGFYPLINIPTKCNPENRITRFALLDQF